MNGTSRRKSRKLPSSYYFRATPTSSRLYSYSNGGSVTFTLETNIPKKFWIDKPHFYNNRISRMPLGGSYEIHYDNGSMTGITITGAPDVEYPTSSGASNFMFSFELNIINPLTWQQQRRTSQVNIAFHSGTDEAAMFEEIPIIP